MLTRMIERGSQVREDDIVYGYVNANANDGHSGQQSGEATGYRRLTADVIQRGRIIRVALLLSPLAGLCASADGALTADTRPWPVRTGLRIENIRHRGRTYVLETVSCGRPSPENRK